MIYEALAGIQAELKAPKGQKNTFGGYNYRSAEDILEAVKPLCKKYGVTVTLSDDIEVVDGWHYVKATATLTSTDGKETTSAHAYAREAETKKGMDDSQITGTASSYARKYAMNGLFAIDDTKDADTDEYRASTANRNASTSRRKASTITKEQMAELEDLIEQTSTDVEAFKTYYNISALSEMQDYKYDSAVGKLRRKLERANG